MLSYFFIPDSISADYIKKEKCNIENNKVSEPNTTNKKKILNINKIGINVKTDMKNDLEYVNKSKKLEALLGNIKSKKSKNSDICVNKNQSKENKKLDGNKNDIIFKTNFDKSQNENESKESNLKVKTIENIGLDNVFENTHTVRDSSSPIYIELNSDETDQEDSMNVSLDDNTLFFLENIEIPIVNKS